MKTLTSKSFLLLLLISLSQYLFAQSEDESASLESEFTVSLSLGHTSVLEGVRDGDNAILSLPSWAVDVNYYVQERWLVGLHGDVIIENFRYRPTSDASSVRERKLPVALVGVIGHRYKSIYFYAGGGAEFGEETFGMVRLGVEYAHRFSERYEMVLGLSYDDKIDGYNSLSLTAGVAYRL